MRKDREKLKMTKDGKSMSVRIAKHMSLLQHRLADIFETSLGYLPRFRVALFSLQRVCSIDSISLGLSICNGDKSARFADVLAKDAIPSLPYPKSIVTT